jgi:pilus assembly protein CpaE
MKTLSVLVSGRDRGACESARHLLEGQSDFDVSLAIIGDGHADPLRGQRDLPDALVLLLDRQGEDVLQALGARGADERPPTIIVGPAADATLMRRAMKAGARDYFSPPLQQAEICEALRAIGRERGLAEPAGPRGKVIAVINAKGGSGASTIAANIAHLQTLAENADVALVDLDLQFGALPLAFDLTPHHSLVDILPKAERLDAAMLKAQATRHASGVAVFSAMSDEMPLPWEQSARSLRQFLELACDTYGTVVVDLPRQIDPLTTTVLEQADRVLVVMQQSLAHVRDAKRLLRVLASSLAVPSANVTLVINRYHEGSGLDEQSIVDAVAPPAHFVLPNDYKTVSDAQNIGVPLKAHDKSAAITRALAALLDRLTREEAAVEEAPPKRRGLRAMFSRA